MLLSLAISSYHYLISIANIIIKFIIIHIIRIIIIIIIIIISQK